LDTTLKNLIAIWLFVGTAWYLGLFAALEPYGPLMKLLGVAGVCWFSAEGVKAFVDHVRGRTGIDD
jgi:hypothetical protein